jgi:uncharacterized protein
VSGIFISGPPYAILNAWRDGIVDLVISPPIIQEYQRVSQGLSAQSPEIDLSEIMSLLMTRVEMVDAADLPEHVCADPDDDKFIACALAGSVPCVVSGDKRLRDVGAYRGARALTPRAFVDALLRSGSDRRAE